jgi:uncharacterized protein YlxW (UPF0749 family)
MRSRGSWAALTVIFVLFGFMLATQFRARPPIAGNLQYQRAEELSVLLKVTEEERDSLIQEVSALRDKVAQMQAGRDQEQVLREELNKARVLAGLTEVKGPGVVIEMTDSQKAAQPGQDPNVFLIHDKDLQDVINAAFGAGAEALSVNGQRFVSRTEVVCAGNVIMINGVRVAPPFKILAIGDPAVLENGLNIRGGVVTNLQFWGIDVKVKQEQEIIVPAFQGALDFKFAQPAQKEATN